MVILNLDLGEELERKFYKRAKSKNQNYLDYVSELIIDDLRKYDAILEEKEKRQKEDGSKFQTSSVRLT